MKVELKREQIKIESIFLVLPMIIMFWLGSKGLLYSPYHKKFFLQMYFVYVALYILVKEYEITNHEIKIGSISFLIMSLYIKFYL